MKNTKFLVAGSIVASLVLAGCGDDAGEKIAEKATEKAIESADGANGDVDVDIDSDGGKVKIKSKDGEGTFETGGDLPAWASDELPIPKGSEVITNVDTPEGKSVQMSVDGNAKEVFEKFKSDLTDKGIDIADESSMDMEDAAFYMLEVPTKEGKVAVTFTGGDDNTTLIQIALTPEVSSE